MSQEKPKVAFYWAASCGGCEIAVLEIHEAILDVAGAVDIVFWPCVMDFKYKDVEAMEEGYIDFTFFNGAIRSSENEEIALLLREKSKALIAFGSCANEGGIPALANLTSLEKLRQYVYEDSPSTGNPDGVLPKTELAVSGCDLHLPTLYPTVRTLGDVVDVDYFMPGCPPVADQILNVFTAALSGQLPPPGSVVGAGDKVVCDECPYEKKNTLVNRFRRVQDFTPEGTQCLLEQGLVCMGPATRSGCGAQCLKAAMPCRGCYGPPAGVSDQGAKLVGAIGSLVDATQPEEAERIIGDIVDPAGTFYRFSMGNSILRRAKLS